MKTVTLIIPDEYDSMLSIVVVGNCKRGGVNVAQYLKVLNSNEVTVNLVEEIIAEKESESNGA